MTAPYYAFATWVEVNGKRDRMSAWLSSVRDRVRVEVDPLEIVFVPKG